MTDIIKSGLSRRSFLAAAGAFGAASLAAPRFATSADGKILKVRSYSDLQILDPAFRLSIPEGDIMRAIYAGLVVPNAGDEWGWQKHAVESIEQLDETTIAFKLRDKIGFTDGFGQMTAEDVKFSFERVADPANESPYAGDWAELKEVEVKDKLSGIIHLKNPFVPLWTSTLPTPSCCILSKAAVEQELGKIGTKPIAQSGQYLLSEWTPKQRTVLKRNPDWAYEPGGYEEIQIFPIEDPATAELGFEAGDIDHTLDGGLLASPRLKENPPAGGVVLEKAVAGLCLARHQPGRRSFRQPQHPPRGSACDGPGDRSSMPPISARPRLRTASSRRACPGIATGCSTTTIRTRRARCWNRKARAT